MGGNGNDSSVNGGNRRKTIVRVVLVVMVLAVGALAVYAFVPDLLPSAVRCTRSDYFEALGDVPDDWDDAINLAASTPRMQLAGRIDEMQDIKRAADRLDIPSCGKAAHIYLIKSMESYIDGFTAFMAQEPDATVERKMRTASGYHDDWMDALDEIDD